MPDGTEQDAAGEETVVSTAVDGAEDDDAVVVVPAAGVTTEAEVQRLRRELEEVKEKVVRWQKVNNKLIHKLKRTAV